MEICSMPRIRPLSCGMAACRGLSLLCHKIKKRRPAEDSRLFRIQARAGAAA
jgi:hypothetical protein